MSGGSQIFFGAATPACWTVSLVSIVLLPSVKCESTFNQEKAILGGVIVKFLRTFV